MSLVGGDHQSRASAFVHRVDLGAVAEHQLKSRDVLCERGGVQWGPAKGGGGRDQRRFFSTRIVLYSTGTNRREAVGAASPSFGVPGVDHGDASRFQQPLCSDTVAVHPVREQRRTIPTAVNDLF